MSVRGPAVVDALTEDIVTPMITMETGSFRLCQQETVEKLRQTNGKYKVMHKLRGIKPLLNERMYVKVALLCYRLINLGRHQD